MNENETLEYLRELAYKDYQNKQEELIKLLFTSDSKIVKDYIESNLLLDYYKIPSIEGYVPFPAFFYSFEDAVKENRCFRVNGKHYYVKSLRWEQRGHEWHSFTGKTGFSPTQTVQTLEYTYVEDVYERYRIEITALSTLALAATSYILFSKPLYSQVYPNIPDLIDLRISSDRRF